MTETDDILLMRSFCADRDEAAFAQLVGRHLGMVHGVALRRLRSRVLAEEVAQNVFTRLAVKADAVARHPERLRGWLHRTAWLEADPDAAAAAFAKLPHRDRGNVMKTNDSFDHMASEALLNVFPGLWWQVYAKRQDSEAMDAATAEEIATAAGAGELDPVHGTKRAGAAFARLAKTDALGALARAERLTDEPMRTAVLGQVRLAVAAESESIDEIEAARSPSPAGYTRVTVARHFAELLAVEDPEAAVARVKSLPASAERDGMVGALVSRWADRDPWRLLENVLGAWVFKDPAAALAWEDLAVRQPPPQKTRWCRMPCSRPWRGGTPRRRSGGWRRRSEERRHHGG